MHNFYTLHDRIASSAYSICIYLHWTCAISAYHHYSCEFDLCNKVYQWLATCRWFSPGTPVSFTNKTDHHNIAEILWKVALSTIAPTPITTELVSSIPSVVRCTRYKVRRVLRFTWPVKLTLHDTNWNVVESGDVKTQP